MALCITLCLLFCYATSAEKYVLTSLHTVTKSSCHPEFTAVSFVNERQITRFDSENKTLTPMHAWVREALSDHYWDVYKQAHLSEYARLREELNVTMKSLGHIKDVHTFQRRSGCEWDDKTNHVKGFDEYGYDGEDFISLDLNRMKYVPHTPLANITAERWNSNKTLLESQRLYYNTECVNWLKRFGRTNLKQTGNILFYQKKPFSPVICHVSGFCPSALKISWHKDGKEMKENISIGAVLPDGDGTYLRDISIFSDEFNISHFTCVVGDSYKDLSVDSLNFKNSNSHSDTESAVHTAIFCITALCIVGVIVCVGGLVWYFMKTRSETSNRNHRAVYQPPQETESNL